MHMCGLYAHLFKPGQCLVGELVFPTVLFHIFHEGRKDRLELLERGRHGGQLTEVACDRTSCCVGERTIVPRHWDFWSY